MYIGRERSSAFRLIVFILRFIIVLIFLYFYKPFEVLFTTVVKDVSFDNVIFWAALIAGIVGFCGYHWRAYRLHIVQNRSVESMVLSSLKGSTFTAILLSGGATLQAVQILSVYLVREEVVLVAELGKRVTAVLALIVLTGIFCIIFWLLKLVRSAPQS